MIIYKEDRITFIVLTVEPVLIKEEKNQEKE